MNPSIAATLLVSLRRTRAAWPIVAAAGLTCVLATTLLAAGPIYANAVSVAGLHRVLADAPVEQANVQASLRVIPAEVAAADVAVTGAIEASFADVGGVIVRSARSGTFDLPLAVPGAVPDLVNLAWMEGLADRATLVGGTWPESASATTGDPVPVAVADVVALPLGLAVGQELALTSRLDPDTILPARIVGIFRIDDPSAPAWWDERQVLDGLVTSDDFATHGPFFTTREHLFERATTRSTELTWRAFPQVSALTIDSMAGLRTRVAGLDARIEAATGGIPTTVTTGLPEILEDAERSLLVSRTGVLVLIVQLAVLAAYAVLLSAALLVEHRRVDTAMLRSRGAGPARIGALALVEGLLLTVPAAVLGPLIAVAALGLLDVVGPLAAIGLQIDPVVSIDAFLASIAGATACLVALILPALPTRRSFAAATSGVSRAATVPTGQRLGLDVALIAVAAIGLWQLRHYGAPLTQSVQGAVGIDPLLVAAPAIGLLAGAVVALRLLPLLAALIERATSRGRGLVSSLGARQLARRPLRYTRAALLLMLAMSMGVFAVSYTHTWTASQVDQAGFQVGADVRVEPGTRAGSVPRWGADQAYASLSGGDGPQRGGAGLGAGVAIRRGHARRARCRRGGGDRDDAARPRRCPACPNCWRRLLLDGPAWRRSASRGSRARSGSRWSRSSGSSSGSCSTTTSASSSPNRSIRPASPAGPGSGRRWSSATRPAACIASMARPRPSAAARSGSRCRSAIRRGDRGVVRLPARHRRGRAPPQPARRSPVAGRDDRGPRGGRGAARR